MTFQLTNNKNPVINAINKAKKFIKIIAFQFTSEKFIQHLIEKSKSGVNIELITLPEDSFSKQEERNKITQLFNDLRSNGINIQLCDWEVGDPTLTNTSMSGELKEGGGNKWYSLHGKLVITENVSLIMSFNFVDQDLCESYFFSKDELIIKSFLESFERFKNWFINPIIIDSITINGTLLGNLSDKDKLDVLGSIKNSNQKLIKEYPPNLTPEINLSQGIYISPFEGRLRNILYELIDQSEDFLYIASERLFDDDFVKYIGKKLVNNENLQIKILTGPPQGVRQNIQKAIQQFRQIKIFGGEIRALENLHAKFWLNEKNIIITSSNLTKMSLGFPKSNNYWRANTELCFIDNQKESINSAKREFERIFTKSKTIEQTLTETSQALGRSKLLFDFFELKSRNEAKVLLGKLRLKFTIDTEKNLIRIAKYSSILVKRENGTFIEKKHVLMGAILLILQNRSSTIREINEKLSEICSEVEIRNNINTLVNMKLLEIENDVYKLNIEQLLHYKSNKSKNSSINEFL